MNFGQDEFKGRTRKNPLKIVVLISISQTLLAIQAAASNQAQDG